MDYGWVRFEFIYVCFVFSILIFKIHRMIQFDQILCKRYMDQIVITLLAFLADNFKFTCIVGLEQVILVKNQTFPCFWVNLRSSREILLRHIPRQVPRAAPWFFYWNSEEFGTSVGACYFRLANLKQQSIADSFLHPIVIMELSSTL